MKKTSTFEKKLKEAQELLEKSEAPIEEMTPTKITKPQKVNTQEFTEDFMKNKELTKQSRKKPFSQKYYGKEPVTEELKKKLKMMEYSEPTKMDSEPNIHKKGSPASKYITSQQSKNKLFRKIGSILSSPLTKKAAALGGALGIAADVLSAEDIAGEEEQLKERERERLFESLPEEVKAESKAISKKRIKPEELLQKDLKDTISPMIKEVGGEEDMRPSRADKMLGEKEDEDIEDMSNIVNYEDYLKRRKKLFGYE